MNETEALYACHLDELVASGVILAWWFESAKFNIAAAGQQPSFYRPDFMLQMADKSIELHEVKGFTTEAARLRVKTAAGLYPFKFVLVQRLSQKAMFESGSPNRWKQDSFAIGEGVGTSKPKEQREKDEQRTD